MTDNNDALYGEIDREIELVLTDPESKLSPGAMRALKAIQDAIAASKPEPQAQAGEPPIAGWRVLIAGLYEFFRHQEDAQAEREQHDKYELANGGEVGEAPEPLITLQFHREAMETLRVANEINKGTVAIANKYCDDLREAIAKKDAALKACVEALETCQMIEGATGWEYLYDIQKVEDATTQAQEAQR